MWMRKGFQMDEPARRILSLFDQMNSDTLDLHTLFEAGGNDPDARGRVVDVVSRMVQEGLLEERGSDFYKLTDKGRRRLAAG
jgi:DNA-binding PadR family transcriptional regulator